ncbi:MAG TPA: response regulator transcription factor [Acidimicrobiia bacterium]|nr:response regulator transcription factor [Acidimicrobiia bacterium]
MASVLLIEDDPDIRRLVGETLAAGGHQVTSADTAMSGLQSVVERRPDLVILDLGLPDLDGSELLRMIRSVSAVPVIAATARGDERDVVDTLDAGADDYLVKPFSVGQLEARVRAVLRRAHGAPEEPEIRIGDLVIDAQGRTLHKDDIEIELTPKEFELLVYLAERPGQVVSRQELLAEVWRQPFGGADRTIDVHLSWLRKKLGESAAEPRYLHTVHGVGVKLVDPAG